MAFCSALPLPLGASGPAPVGPAVPGYRSICALWLGGAAASTAIPPVPGGGWGPGRPSREEVYIRLREASDLFGKEFDDVDEAAILAAVLWTLEH
jgi:hypothetical protein